MRSLRPYRLPREAVHRQPSSPVTRRAQTHTTHSTGHAPCAAARRSISMHSLCARPQKLRRKHPLVCRGPALSAARSPLRRFRCRLQGCDRGQCAAARRPLESGSRSCQAARSSPPGPSARAARSPPRAPASRALPSALSRRWGRARTRPLQQPSVPAPREQARLPAKPELRAPRRDGGLYTPEPQCRCHDEPPSSVGTCTVFCDPFPLLSLTTREVCVASVRRTLGAVGTRASWASRAAGPQVWDPA